MGIFALLDTTMSYSSRLFIAHLIAGTVLFIQGTWWATGAWHAYSVHRHRQGYYARRAYFVLPGIKPRCIEGFFKMACGLSGFVFFVSITVYDGFFQGGAQVQHSSATLFFCLNGVIDVLTDYGAPLPPGSDYVGLLMALSVEALLFHLHLHGRQQLDIIVHTLFVLTVVLEIVCVAVEMVRRRSFLATLGRAFFAILQGTWFFQIAFILYNQLPGAVPWEDNHQSSMVASAMYTWHAFGVLLYLALIGQFASMFSSKCRGSGETGSARSALLPMYSGILNRRSSLDSVRTRMKLDRDDDRGDYSSWES